jgi:hypothetical protein
VRHHYHLSGADLERERERITMQSGEICCASLAGMRNNYYYCRWRMHAEGGVARAAHTDKTGH